MQKTVSLDLLAERFQISTSDLTDQLQTLDIKIIDEAVTLDEDDAHRLSEIIRTSDIKRIRSEYTAGPTEESSQESPHESLKRKDYGKRQARPKLTRLKKRLSKRTTTTTFVGAQLLSSWLVLIAALNFDYTIWAASFLATACGFLCGGISFLASENDSNFITYFLIAVLIAGPLNLLVVVKTPLLFWLYLCLLVLLTILEVIITFDEEHEVTERALMLFHVAFVMTTFFTTAGTSFGFTFSKPATQGYIGSILDLRLGMSLVLLISIGILGFLRSIHEPSPDIPEFPRIRIGNRSRDTTNLLQSFIEPFNAAARIALRVLTTAMEVIYTLLAYTFHYLLRTGTAMASIIWNLLSNRDLWIATGRNVTIISILLAHILASLTLSQHLFDHLQGQTSTGLPKIALYFAFSLVCIITIPRIIDWSLGTDSLRTKTLITRCAFCSTVSMVIFAINGLLAWTAQNFFGIDLRGHLDLGTFTSLISGIVLIALILQIVGIIRDAD